MAHLLLNVPPQLGQLGFTLLVELDLGRGGAAGLVQALTQLLELAGLKRAGEGRQGSFGKWEYLLMLSRFEVSQ